MSDTRSTEAPPDNNVGKFRIPGEDSKSVANTPIMTSDAFERYKQLRMDFNQILQQNKSAFTELALLAPGDTAKNPEIQAVLMLLARLLENADSRVMRESK